jgi:DNA-binding response OmpR family regulator
MLKSVLIIEDEIALRDLLVEEMTASGFKPLIASNGQEGLDVILSQEPDLVICDRAMPHMSGFELLQRLRGGFPQYRGLPFIFLTALSDERDRIAATDLCPSAYLTKPVDFNLLQRTILKALDNAELANA